LEDETMSIPYTTKQATHPTQDVKLPCGITVALHRVKNRDRDDVVEQYIKFLEPIAILLERTPEQNEAHGMMPEVLRDTFVTRVPIPPEMEEQDPEMADQVRNIGRTAVLAFFNFFSETPLDAATVERFDIDDYAAIWDAIWEIARYPFALGYTAAVQDKRLDNARMEWKQMNQPNSASSSEPESTPETQTSKQNSASRSRKRKPNTKNGSPRASDTGADTDTPPPTPESGPS
jgi:hypothetical protein